MSAIPPLMLKTESNPGGLRIEVFDQLHASVLAGSLQLRMELSMSFYGYNRPGRRSRREYAISSSGKRSLTVCDIVCFYHL